MFLGTYIHTVDERSRVSIPKRFRKKLSEKTVITKGLDYCLFLYSQASWAKIEDQLKQTQLTRLDARNLSRHILSGAMEVSIDRLGRIILPSYLKTFAQIEKEVAILGVGERIEIWGKNEWEEYSKQLDKQSNEIAERLSESGL